MDSGVLKQFSFFVELTNFVFVHVDVCTYLYAHLCHAFICGLCLLHVNTHLLSHEIICGLCLL